MTRDFWHSWDSSDSTPYCRILFPGQNIFCGSPNQMITHQLGSASIGLLWGAFVQHKLMEFWNSTHSYLTRGEIVRELFERFSPSFPHLFGTVITISTFMSPSVEWIGPWSWTAPPYLPKTKTYYYYDGNPELCSPDSDLFNLPTVGYHRLGHVPPPSVAKSRIQNPTSSGGVSPPKGHQPGIKNGIMHTETRISMRISGML